jgi:hypothetical protein
MANGNGKTRPTFTDDELKAIRVMCDASVPTPIYDGTMSTVRKIDDYFGRRITEEEVTLAYRARFPPVRDPVIEKATPPKAIGPIPVDVTCLEGHLYQSIIDPHSRGMLRDPICPKCRRSWRSFNPVHQ